MGMVPLRHVPERLKVFCLVRRFSWLFGVVRNSVLVQLSLYQASYGKKFRLLVGVKAG
jgi:hypothetical protein